MNTRLGEIGHVAGGLQITPKRADLPIEVPYLRVANVHRDSLDLSAIKTIRITEAELSRTRLIAGDLLLVEGHGNRDELGRVAIWDGSLADCTHQNHLIRVRVDRQLADPAYVSRFLNSEGGRSQLLRMGKTTSGLNTISTSQVADLRLRLPPLPEQRRIAAILDEADALRRKRREALALLDDLLRATFLDMFGDPVTNPRGWKAMLLNDLADVQGGLQVTAQRAEPLEVPYLRVANVYRDRLDLREIKTIRVTPAERERVRLQHGDVLVVEGHGNPDEVGRSAVWDRAEEMLHQNHLIRVRANRARLDSVYLSAFLNSQGGRRQMVRAEKTTSGLNTISTSNIKAMTVHLPPLQLQRQWSDFVRACSTEGRRAEGHLAHVDALFFALLHCAFAGSI
jgi:type I restriction enzyme, S subunit